MSVDPYKFKVTKEDWILVLDDERKKVTDGGIFLMDGTTDLERVSPGSGTIVSISLRGNILKTEDLAPGMRVCYRDFIKFANPIELDTEEKWPSGEKKRFFLMSSADAMAVLDKSTSIFIYAGRPEVPSGPRL